MPADAAGLPMQNIEFKAELRDLPLARTICLALGGIPIAVLEQTDTYFRLPAGRLKRREVPGEPTQIIFYHRADRTLPKISNYTIYTESHAMLLYGTHQLDAWVVVRKSRELIMLGAMRIHLDRVDHLGTFLEVEAVVTPANHVGRCHESIRRLRAELQHCLGEPIAVSYSDLMAQRLESTP